MFKHLFIISSLQSVDISRAINLSNQFLFRQTYNFYINPTLLNRFILDLQSTLAVKKNSDGF